MSRVPGLVRSRRLARAARRRRRDSLAFETLENRQLLAGGFSVGVNLAGVNYFDSLAFVDVMRQSAQWRTTNESTFGAPYNTRLSDSIPVDADGWPTQSPFDPGNGLPPQVPHTVLPVRGAGTYTLFAEGEGTLRFRASDGLLDPDAAFFHERIIELTGGPQVIDFEVYESAIGDGVGELFLYLDSSDPQDIGDYVRDVSLVMPGFESTYQTDPFLPSFTDDLSVFDNLRYMDWAETNNNPTVEWSDRTLPTSYTQSRDEGVSVELMIEMSNAQNQDAWITVPARADDEYVFALATAVRDGLDPGLKVFVEYSNETWNGQFSQTEYVSQQGLQLGLAAQPFQAGNRFVAMRSAQIWDSFESVFGDDAGDRIVKVLATQAANPSVSNQRLEALSDPAFNPTGTMPDALAFNGYFGSPVANRIVSEGLVETITTEEILEQMRNDLEGRVVVEMEVQRSIAEQYGLWLVTYEGGQHLVGTGANLNNDALTEKLIQANRHPQMYDLYRRHMDLLLEADVVLHSSYAYVYEANKFGSWGLQEDQDQPIETAHKLRAVLDWTADNPVANVAPRVAIAGELRHFDVDGDGFETITLSGSGSRDFDGTIQGYQWFQGNTLVGVEEDLIVHAPFGATDYRLVVTDDGSQTSESTVTVTVVDAASESILVDASFQGPAPGDLIWDQTDVLSPDITYSGWTLGSGLKSSGASGALGFKGFFGGGGTDLAAAMTKNDFIEFTIQPTDPAASLDLHGGSVEMTIDRRDFWAARNYAFFVSTDGFATQTLVFDSETIDTLDAVELEYDLPFDVNAGTGPAQFRLYAYNGRFGNKATDLVDFVIRGTVQANESSNNIAIDPIFLGGHAKLGTSASDLDDYFGGVTDEDDPKPPGSGFMVGNSGSSAASASTYEPVDKAVTNDGDSAFARSKPDTVLAGLSSDLGGDQ